MSGKLHDKIYGWLMGAAVGDAMGAPVENMHYRDIREQYGLVEGFKAYEPNMSGGRPDYESFSYFWHERRKPDAVGAPHPFGAWQLKAGVYTDDLRWRLLAIQSFIRHGRRITGWEFAEDMLEYRVESARYAPSDPRNVWAKGMFNLDELFQMCLKSPFGHTLLVGGIWGSPAGIIHAADPRTAAQDGGLVGAITAAAMHPRATVDSLIQTAFDFAGALPEADYACLSTWGGAFHDRLERALGCADACGDVYELTEKLYEWICTTCPPFNVQNIFEALVVALAMVYKAKADFRQAVLGSVNFGRDCDSIACVAGELIGALRGIACVPDEWVQVINRENPEPCLNAVAAQAVDVIVAEAKRASEIAGLVLDRA